MNTGMLEYYKFLEASNVTSTATMPAAVKINLDIMEYCRGWAKLVYCGPYITHAFIDQQNFINPRQPNLQHITTLQDSILTTKLDHCFPLDVLVDFRHVSPDLAQDIQVDGSKANVAVPRFWLIGVSEEERVLHEEIWLWTSMQTQQQLSLEQHNHKVMQLRRLEDDPSRYRAKIIGGRQRNMAMQLLAAPVFEQQQKLMMLSQQESRTEAEEGQLEILAGATRDYMQFLEFRIRLFDSNMPPHLLAELAKNQDAEPRQGPKMGEDQNRDKTHAEVMNIWHDQYLSNTSQTFTPLLLTEQASGSGKKGAPREKKKNTGQKKSLTEQVLQLPNSPTCTEMLLSCGRASEAFELVLTATNIGTLSAESGGLLLATLWLDMLTLLKVTDFQTNGPSFSAAQSFVRDLSEPESADGLPDAVPVWEQYCMIGAQVPAGLVVFSKKLSDSYGAGWADYFAVNPKSDSTYTAPRWTDTIHILKKRRVFWKYGQDLSESHVEHVQRLSVAIRLYAILPLMHPGVNPKNCFHPASDLPCKRKMAQLERQLKLVFVGTGLVMLSMALSRHDLIWYLSKHLQNWYLTQSATHRIVQRCTSSVLDAPEDGLSKAITILQSNHLKEGLQLAESHFPKYGMAGTNFHSLQSKCSTSRSGSQDFEILESLVARTTPSSVEDLKAQCLAARQGMIDYAKAHNPSLLPNYLERFPILLELVGDFFFSQFEFLRYVHGGRAGATTATFEKSPLAAVSAAIGMGILVDVLEREVMSPLMTNHVRARYILQAAAEVEDYSPSIVDGESESLWWQYCMPWKIPTVDLPLHPARVNEMQHAETPTAVTLTLPQAADADVTMSAIHLDPFGFDKTDIYETSHWPEGGSPPHGFSSTFPPLPDSQPQSHASMAAAPQLPTQSEAIPEPGPSSVDVPAGRFVRWDKVMENLPYHISCPNTPASTLPHHIQGTTLAIRNVTHDDQRCLECLDFARTAMPVLLPALFEARQILRTNIQTQLDIATKQANGKDYIVNVLAPTFIQLKQNYLVHITRAFMQFYRLNQDEAQTEALYMALTDQHWEKDILDIDDDGIVWIDYACTLPKAAWQQVASTMMKVGQISPLTHEDHALTSIFLDGSGSGIREGMIQHGRLVAHVLQDIHKSRRFDQHISWENSEDWDSVHMTHWGPLHLDKSYYNKDNFLETFGRKLNSKEIGYTCWNKGSPFATGVFVDWSCLDDAASTQLTQWGDVEAGLHSYQTLMDGLWNKQLEVAIADVKRILGLSSPKTSLTNVPSMADPVALNLEPDAVMLPSPNIAVEQSPQTVAVFVPGTPSDEGDIYDDIPLSQPRPVSPTLSLLTSRVEATPPLQLSQSRLHGTAYMYNELDGSDEEFELQTGLMTLAVADPNDPDDPDNFGGTGGTRYVPPALEPSHAQIKAHLPALGSTQASVSRITWQSSTQQGLQSLTPGGQHDPDDPDNLTERPAVQSQGIGLEPTVMLGRKRSATETSPKEQLRKRDRK
ncbi:hypothetical protein FRC12_024400 [Ceratobasidium sp. 428]|nr:hypothetical protein FRC12_024400 [Ceratobasidium sp. 428]